MLFKRKEIVISLRDDIISTEDEVWFKYKTFLGKHLDEFLWQNVASQMANPIIMLISNGRN